jgi:ribosomal protein L37AE/L43A
MNYGCPICSANLLRHIRKQGIYWRCPACRQEFSKALISRVNAHCGVVEVEVDRSHVYGSR